MELLDEGRERESLWLRILIGRGVEEGDGGQGGLMAE